MSGGQLFEHAGMGGVITCDQPPPYRRSSSLKSHTFPSSCVLTPPPPVHYPGLQACLDAALPYATQRKQFGQVWKH